MKTILATLLLAAAGASAGPKDLPCSYLGKDGVKEQSACLEEQGAALSVKKQLLARLAFDRGLAAVWSKDTGWMYIDKAGKVLIAGVAAMDNGPDGFHDGLVRFEQQGRCGYANRRGKAVIAPAYDGCLNFINGIARACLRCKNVCAGQDCEHRTLAGGEWVCLDTTGRRVACIP
ncbi:MAG: WG repeat-containing protein [Elusimicrobia bacterium]|nr:WG repeat-containing protein [Elusimicrobiota bacterium]